MPLYDFEPCQPDDLLTSWSEWSECDASCDMTGTMNRTRVCGNDEFTEVEEIECSGESCACSGYLDIENACQGKIKFSFGKIQNIIPWLML